MGPVLRSIAFAALIASAALPAIAAERGQDIGATGAVTPSATASLDAQRRDLVRDAAIRFGERIETTTKGNAGIVFEDRTRLYVAENSDIEIDEYVFGGGSALDIRLVSGVLRLASGRIGGANISVRTTVAEIGLRGTVISVSAEPTRTVLYVEQGAAVAAAGGQTVTVAEGQSLVIDADGAGQPLGGWPASLNTAVAAMATSLATAATPAAAVPSELAERLDAAAAEASAAEASSPDGGFNYN